MAKPNNRHLLLIKGVGGPGVSGVFGNDLAVPGDLRGVFVGDVADILFFVGPGNFEGVFFGESMSPFVVGL